MFPFNDSDLSSPRRQARCRLGALVIVLSLAGAATAYGQAGAQTSSPALRARQWEKLQSYRRVSATVSDATTLAATVVEYERRADEIHAFAANETDPTRKSEAARLEALNLLFAEMNGATDVADRSDALVAAVRHDPTLSVQARYEIAFWADHRGRILAAKPASEGPRQRLEHTARDLIVEFPEIPEAYESLLHIADESDDAVAAKSAHDLLAASAPDPIKAAAQRLLDRQALVGQSLQSLFEATLPTGSRPAVGQGGFTVLYTWATNSENCYLMSKFAAKAPAKTTFIGVSLESGTTAAQAAAQLPGVQIYDPAGSQSALVHKLGLVGHDVVLVANRQGRIVLVTASLNLARRLDEISP